MHSLDAHCSYIDSTRNTSSAKGVVLTLDVAVDRRTLPAIASSLPREKNTHTLSQRPRLLVLNVLEANVMRLLEYHEHFRRRVVPTTTTRVKPRTTSTPRAGWTAPSTSAEAATVTPNAGGGTRNAGGVPATTIDGYPRERQSKSKDKKKAFLVANPHRTVR